MPGTPVVSPAQRGRQAKDKPVTTDQLVLWLFWTWFLEVNLFFGIVLVLLFVRVVVVPAPLPEEVLDRLRENVVGDENPDLESARRRSVSCAAHSGTDAPS